MSVTKYVLLNGVSYYSEWTCSKVALARDWVKSGEFCYLECVFCVGVSGISLDYFMYLI